MKKAGLYIQAGLYIMAGINHFINPAFYQLIMPPWMPWHYPLIYISGLAELLCGIFFIPVRTRRVAAWAIIMLLIAIYPANIQMAINYFQDNNPKLWIALLRLPLQVLLVWWAWIYTRRDKKL